MKELYDFITCFPSDIKVTSVHPQARLLVAKITHSVADGMKKQRDRE